MGARILPDTDSLAQAGNISRKVGFKGQLLAELQDEFPSAVKSGDWMFVELQQCLVPFRVQEVQYRNPYAFVFVPELACKQWEEMLTGCNIYLSGTKIKSKKKKENSLLGFAVEDKQAGFIGTVTDILEYPMQVLLQVNHDKNETLIPWVDAFILDVDKRNKIIRCDLPEGLYQMNGSDAEDQ